MKENRKTVSKEMSRIGITSSSSGVKKGYNKFIKRKTNKKKEDVCPMRRTGQIEYIRLPMILVSKVNESLLRVMYVH
jgi:hypothetical protein